jgi:peptide-methionine (R)-S-oxide reductase
VDISKPVSEEEWRKKLTREQYAVLRQKATEAPFSGSLLHNNETGMYTCGACGQPLFSSHTKFESGSGWPSFYEVISKGAVKLLDDDSAGMQRTEVICSHCGSHLGHLFLDAPNQPTGQRFCINSTALGFQKEDK